MKQLPVAGVALATLAFAISLAALFSRGNDDEPGRLVESLKGNASALEGRIVSLEANVESMSAKSVGRSGAVADLSALVGRGESSLTRLGRSIADVPRARAAAGTETDPDKVREAARAEVRAILDRLHQERNDRRGRGGRGREAPAEKERPDDNAAF